MMNVIDTKNLIEQLQAIMKEKTEENDQILKQEIKRIEEETCLQLLQACLQSGMQFEPNQFQKWYSQIFGQPLTKKCHDFLYVEFYGTSNFCDFLKEQNVKLEEQIKSFIEEQEKRKQMKISLDSYYQITQEQIRQVTQNKQNQYLEVFDLTLEQTLKRLTTVIENLRKQMIVFFQNQLKTIQLQTIKIESPKPEYYTTTLYERLLLKQLEQLISEDVSIRMVDVKNKLHKEARDMNQEFQNQITKGTGNYTAEIIRDLIEPLEKLLLESASILMKTLTQIDTEIISFTAETAILPKNTRAQQIKQLVEHYEQKIDFSKERLDTQNYYENFIVSIKKSSPYFQMKGSHNIIFRILSRKKLLLDTALYTFLENTIQYQKNLLIKFINTGLMVEEQIKKTGFKGYEQLENLLEYYETYPEKIEISIEGENK